MLEITVEMRMIFRLFFARARSRDASLGDARPESLDLCRWLMIDARPGEVGRGGQRCAPMPMPGNALYIFARLRIKYAVGSHHAAVRIRATAPLRSAPLRHTCRMRDAHSLAGPATRAARAVMGRAALAEISARVREYIDTPAPLAMLVINSLRFRATKEAAGAGRAGATPARDYDGGFLL